MSESYVHVVDMLRSLESQLDQLHSAARDIPDHEPGLVTAIAVAWYLTEVSLRQAGANECGHGLRPSPKCESCRALEEVGRRTASVRRLLAGMQ